MLRPVVIALILGLAALRAAPAAAQNTLRSECLAMSQAPNRAIPVALRRMAKADEVTITYAGHST